MNPYRATIIPVRACLLSKKYFPFLQIKKESFSLKRKKKWNKQRFKKKKREVIGMVINNLEFKQNCFSHFGLFNNMAFGFFKYKYSNKRVILNLTRTVCSFSGESIVIIHFKKDKACMQRQRVYISE
mgnify:CR=1